MSDKPLHIASDESMPGRLRATTPPVVFGCVATLSAHRPRSADPYPSGEIPHGCSIPRVCALARRCQRPHICSRDSSDESNCGAKYVALLRSGQRLRDPAAVGNGVLSAARRVRHPHRGHPGRSGHFGMLPSPIRSATPSWPLRWTPLLRRTDRPYDSAVRRVKSGLRVSLESGSG